MRRSTVAVVLLALAASTTHAAQAAPACPTLTDDTGDTGLFGYHVQQDASDITAADVSTANKTLTASVTVVGRPVNNEPGMSRVYDVYFDAGEGDYVLRGTLGNSESRFELLKHTQVADTGHGTTVEHWETAKMIRGRVHGGVVTINAPLDRDVPLLGRRVSVFARTWIAAANDVSAGGMTTPDGVAAGVDVTDVRRVRVGDPGCV